APGDVNQRLIVIQPRAGPNHGRTIAFTQPVDDAETWRKVVFVYIEITRKRQRRSPDGLRDVVEFVTQPVVDFQPRRHLPVVLGEEVVVERLVFDRRITDGLAVLRITARGGAASGRHVCGN